MKGWLKVEIQGLNSRIMCGGDRLSIPGQRFHKLTPIRSEPAAYAFIFANGTQQMPSQVQSVDLPKKSFIDSDKYKTIWLMRLEMIKLSLGLSLNHLS